MNAIDISPVEFLRAFSDPAYNLNFRVFDDKKGGTFKGMSLSCDWADVEAMMDTLAKHNSEGRGVFFVVNSGGHTDAAIKRIAAQFVENDTLSLEEQMNQIKAFSLEPSLIVKTSKSLHTYWLIRDGKVENFRPIQKALVAHFGGDPACVNESRVLRVPGFYHCKGDPVMVECVHFKPELRYTQAQLLAHLPSVEPHKDAEIKTVPKGDRRGLGIVRKKCNFIKHCEENAAGLSEHDWYAMISNLAVFEDGEALIHKLSSAYPKYSRDETQKKINHFLGSGTKPMNCSTIAEKGFNCPRLSDGSCSCKSPAGISYVPLDTDTLAAILSEKEVKGSPMADIQTAQSFVRDYLYNLEAGIAEIFINYAMKDHFKFKGSDLKPLLTLFREVHKKYTQNREAKETLGGEAFPEWYTFGERGAVIFKPGILSGFLKDNVDAFYGAEQYYLYRNGVYKSSTDTEARAVVQSYLLPEYATFNNITDAEGQWKLKILKSLGEVNCNPYILNLRNGLYNVLDGSFREHTPGYYSTIQLACSYNPDAVCPRFEKYLSDVLLTEDIPLVQEILGYFLVPVTKAQKSFVIVGAAGSGKTQLLNTINTILLGKENVSNVEWQQLNDRFKTAELYGKLANIFADLPSKNLDDNGIFKALVGEDHLTVERKNKDPFSFQPSARLLFSCNNMPRNYGDKSEGFYRRLIIIRYPNSVPDAKKDADLFSVFQSEADGILNFALAGLKRLMANKYKFSETENTKRELANYRMENNSVLSFIHECCTLEPGAAIEKTELYNRYKEYCKAAGFNPFSTTNFNRDMETGFPSVTAKRDTLGKRRIWAGIKFASDD